MATRKPKIVKNSKNVKPIFTGSDWNQDTIERIYEECRIIAEDELKLDYYPNQLEIISSEQMLDCYSSVGMPMFYNHWSFGKSFVENEQHYKKGQMGLAFEIVINSLPCISYIMEDNTATMQALVIAHAAFGHNSFFKNNYLFKEWTDAGSIVEYLRFAKKYITDCEEKYGYDEVESTLDACHALQDHAINKYKRPKKLSLLDEERLLKERNDYHQANLNMLWEKTIPKFDSSVKQSTRFPKEPQENILYFVEKNAPNLPTWKREIIRIVRKIAEYFHPQRLTKVTNEGFASFSHYHIMTRLNEKGLITNGSYLEFLQSHTSVVHQPSYDSKYFSGFNPYALGFEMLRDVERMSKNPTAEDKKWFPDFAGGDWVENVKHVAFNHSDSEALDQFVSPKLIRDFHLFSVLDDYRDDKLEISNIHNDTGYRNIRESLAKQYDIDNILPNIQVYDVNRWKDRSITLRHYSNNHKLLHHESAVATLKNLNTIWEFDCVMESVDENDKVMAEYIVSKGETTYHVKDADYDD
jgi:spore cortex formation protein SpoVR/YcgB (stage V sporulation)